VVERIHDEEDPMRHLTSLVFLTLALGVAPAVAAPAHGGMAKGKSVTVTGTLIDTKCYSMNSQNKGRDHVTPHGEMKGCAGLCANLGIPVAVLTSKGEVWTLVTPSKDLADHMAETCRVTGVAVYGGRQLRPDKIEVQDAAGHWTEVKITLPMPM
jgi:hypothetical protein